MIDNKIYKKMKRTLKVINRFKNQYSCYLVKKGEIKIELGKPINDIELIPINLSVMTEKIGFYKPSTTQNSKSAYSNISFECFYTYDNKDIDEIIENQKIIIDKTVYRVDRVENNYKLFQRFIIERESTEDSELNNLILRLRE